MAKIVYQTCVRKRVMCLQYKVHSDYQLILSASANLMNYLNMINQMEIKSAWQDLKKIMLLFHFVSNLLH